MSFQDVDRLHGVLDVSSQVDGFHRMHCIHSHRRKKIIIADTQINMNEKKINGSNTDVETHFPIILLDIAVFATLIKASLPRESTFILDWSCINFTASLHARRYPVMIVVGCTLALTSSLALRNSSAAMITTDVVPSPTSLSCFCARSTNIFPAGCSTARRERMVAPSFEIVTS
jgi:hypothetical protein